MTSTISFADRIAYALGETRPPAKYHIPFVGPATRFTGYGNHFVELVLSVLKMGADVSVLPICVVPPLPPEFLATLLEPFPNRPPVAFCMADPAALKRYSHHNIGITTWETTLFPEQDFPKPLITQVDELIVPCKMNIETFSRWLPEDKIHYIPEPVDLEFFKFQDRDWDPDTPLRIGMFGHLTYRKGIDLGLNAFLETFAGDPAVELHVGTTFRGIPQLEFAAKEYGNIHVHYFGFASREQVRDFYYSLHALFAPFRGEGFYLPGAEFMATGGVLIAPNLMGPAAYHTPTTGYIIPAEFGQVNTWGERFGDQAALHGEWLVYNPADVAKALTDFVHSSPSEKRIKAERSSEQIGFYLNPDYIAQQTIDVFVNALRTHED